MAKVQLFLIYIYFWNEIFCNPKSQCPLARVMNKYSKQNIDCCTTVKSNLEKYIELHLDIKYQKDKIPIF